MLRYLLRVLEAKLIIRVSIPNIHFEERWRSSSESCLSSRMWLLHYAFLDVDIVSRLIDLKTGSRHSMAQRILILGGYKSLSRAIFCFRDPRHAITKEVSVPYDYASALQVVT